MEQAFKEQKNDSPLSGLLMRQGLPMMGSRRRRRSADCPGRPGSRLGTGLRKVNIGQERRLWQFMLVVPVPKVTANRAKKPSTQYKASCTSSECKILDGISDQLTYAEYLEFWGFFGARCVLCTHFGRDEVLY